MKTMCKRTLAFLLCAVLLCSALPFVTFAAEDADPPSAVLPADDAGEPAEIPDLDIVNYKMVLLVPVESKLVFHTTADAPEGYQIKWSTGDIGSECVIDQAKQFLIPISADLVRIDDGAVVRSTQKETVFVIHGLLTRLFVKITLHWYDSYFNSIFSGGLGTYHFLPGFEDNRIALAHYVELWDI